MKLKNVFLISAGLMVGLMSSCEKDMDVNPTSEPATVKNKSALQVSETVNLGLAGDFVILTKTGITSVYKSSILGDVGASPITGGAITLSCEEVTGSVFSVDAAGPACKTTNATLLTTAIGDMQAAYTDAAGRANPDYLNLGAGTIGSITLLPGLYKWTSSVNITTDITISGSPTDIFIFQVAGTLNMSSAVRVTLEGGAQAKNIFWVVTEAVTFGTTSHFEGNILGQTAINMKTGATMNGRMLAQTAVTLQMNTVNKPDGDGEVMPDSTLPIINSTDPLNNDTNVAQNKLIAVNFSEKMDAATINATTFTLKQGDTVVPGVVNYYETTATFTPTNLMVAGTIYTALITKGAKDLAGNALADDNEWSFTTEVAPLINSISPLNNATNVERIALISVVFNKTMDASTINASTFTLIHENTVIPGTVSYSEKTATFNPTSVLAAGTIYTALISKKAKDLAGNALAADTEWSFTTKLATANLEVVNLGTSGNYVILAKAAINNNPTSNITGDLGLSPAATSYITGLSLTDATGYATSAQITGKVYAADMVTPTSGNLTVAVGDMTTAYTDAAGRPSPDFLELGTGNIGGKTLTPGLYKWTSSVTLPTDVTISGGENDVWIFQISGDLSISGNVKVTLAGGAQAKNIFWQVAGEAVFGTTSHFEGIILSWTGITFQTGATFKGRALAGTAVILDSNTVVGPN